MEPGREDLIQDFHFGISRPEHAGWPKDWAILARGHVGGLFNNAPPRHCSVAGFEVNTSLRWPKGPLEDGRLEFAAWLGHKTLALTWCDQPFG